MDESEEYLRGRREGREEGAAVMRDHIERYLRAQGVQFPPLPKTLGERKAFERAWDARVKRV